MLALLTPALLSMSSLAINKCPCDSVARCSRSIPTDERIVKLLLTVLSATVKEADAWKQVVNFGNNAIE